MDKYIKTPITAEVTEDLRAGDYVYITGTVYVARDAAHKRLVEALEKTEREFYAERFLSKTDGLQAAAETEGNASFSHRGFRFVLYGSLAGQGRPPHWFCRAYYSKPHG